MARRPHWFRMGVVGRCDGNGCRASQQAVAVSWAFGRCGLGGCDEAVHFSHRSGLLWLAPSLLEPGLQLARRPHWFRMGVVGHCDGNGCRASQLVAAVSWAASEGAVPAAVMRQSTFYTVADYCG
jgi:hypothetical protein